MADQEPAGHRDIVEVTEDDHNRKGERFHVISGLAGIGRRYILACAPENRLERIGLRHDQVAVVGRVPHGVEVPIL